MRGRRARRRSWRGWTIVLLAVVPWARASEPTTDQASFFDREVRPILKARCLKCHGEGAKIKGGLRLDSREAILKGGDQGPAVVLARPDESLLLRAIRYDEIEMPPNGRLPVREQDVLRRWVSEQLPWSGTGVSAHGTVPAPSALKKTVIDWSVRPVARPTVPRPVGPSANPIDAFIQAKLAQEGLRPNPPAERGVLIRRATFDLTGLPPTPEAVADFVADSRPDAYERLVDRLLASPQHGERWARHWLDLVGYAETNGYERDGAKPFAWRYRDYVIDAFNRDKPYDQFLREQIAGDEIDPESAECMTATGYYRLGVWDDEPADRPLARYDGLDTIVATTAQVVLGMTVNCARCHDHKVDPIPQRDYYRLLAFFQDLALPNGKNLKTAKDASGHAIQVMCAWERGQAETHVLSRGNPNLIGEKVEPGVPSLLDPGGTRFTVGPGKRSALVDWLVDPRNPRSARVLANRLWQYHFGRGIVPSSSDFGGLGEPATHPQLLDWLAGELTDGGWRLKPIQRLIMLSNTYRQSSRSNPEALAKDPLNHSLWRFPMRRLSAEEVRDAMLMTSGALCLKLGGPSVRPPIPAEVLAGQSVPGQGWSVSSPREAGRRSVYVHIKRSLLLPILATHDAPDTDSSCPVRFTTTVPTQALGLLNGSFANEQAARLARRVVAERPGGLPDQIRRAISLATSRQARDQEVRDDLELVEWLVHDRSLDPRSALVQYCLLILNANEFVYLD